MTERVYRIVVEVPIEAGAEDIDAIYDAVAAAAHAAEPSDREGWDIFVYGTTVDVADEDELVEFAHELGLMP